MAKNKEDRARAYPFVGVDDGYDEEKYRDLLEKAAEEILENPRFEEN